MTDWSQGFSKLVPGLKVYLLISPYGNVLDQMIQEATKDVQYVSVSECPLTDAFLFSNVGLVGDSQALILRGIESSADEDWKKINNFLALPKFKDLSLVLTGSFLPTSEEAVKVKSKISRQGLYIDAQSPTGESGRKHLVQWFAEECKVTMALSEKVCHDLNFQLDELLWTRQLYLRFSSGKVLAVNVAQKLMYLCFSPSRMENVFSSIVTRKKEFFIPTGTQAFVLFSQLEQFLTDISKMYDLVQADNSPRQVAVKSGVHMVKVLDYYDIANSYPSETVLKCRKALSVGFEYVDHPEVIQFVRALWS